jgi:hypothetical protein
MSNSNLYDDDILLWSEQQAAAIRRLREMARGLPNELDIDNVAEEIESVGRSELAAVKSFLRLILLHLLKLAAAGDSAAAAHWRGEIAAFRVELRDRYARSMKPRIDLDLLWREVRERIVIDPGLVGLDAAVLPLECPIRVDDLIEDPLETNLLVLRLRQSMEPDGNRH